MVQLFNYGTIMINDTIIASPVQFDVCARPLPPLFWSGGSEVDRADLPEVGDDGEWGEAVVLLAGHRDQPHSGPEVVASSHHSLVDNLLSGQSSVLVNINTQRDRGGQCCHGVL